MTTYAWTGRTKAGGIRKGETNANTQQEAISTLRKKNILVTSIKQKASSLNLNINITFGAPVNTHDLVIFTRMFSTMIDAGLPLVQCLDILAGQTENPFMAKSIGEIRQEVEAGSTYADALRKHPKVFDDLYVNMVAAGEAGGILDVILTRLAKHIEKAMKLKSKIKMAMVYPGAILSVAIVVITMLMIFVIPQFAQMFTDFGGDLPYITRMVMNVSYFMQANIFYMIIGIFLMKIAFSKYYSTTSGRFHTDKFMLKAPFFGNLIRKASVAKFTRTLGTLISSGVPILEALSVVAKTAGNAVVEKTILDTRQSISEGKTIAEPLEQSEVFPPMVVQMIAVGETTGALDVMLEKIADFYDDEVDSAVSGLTSLMEPVIMLFLGGAIGIILASMYLPIFKMASIV